MDKQVNVYICYDRYEHDEDHSLFHIDLNRESAMTHFKEIDLPDFLSMGPDDCHTFLLQKVKMKQKEYVHLTELKSIVDTSYNPEAELEIGDFLTKCYADHTNIIYDIDGEALHRRNLLKEETK